MAVGVRLPGTSGEYVSSPDDASFNVSSFEIVARLAADDWTPASFQTIFGKQSQYSFRIDPGGTLTLYRRISSTDYAPASTVAAGLTDGVTYWLRATANATTGDVNFYKADDSDTEPSSWTQIGSTVSSSSGTPDDSANVVTVGTYTASSQNFKGVIHRVILRDAPSGGTFVAEWSAPHTGTRYRDSTGKTWTLTGSAYSTVITA